MKLSSSSSCYLRTIVMRLCVSKMSLYTSQPAPLQVSRAIPVGGISIVSHACRAGAGHNLGSCAVMRAHSIIGARLGMALAPISRHSLGRSEILW